MKPTASDVSIWSNFGLPLCHIINFVLSKFIKVQNQKTLNYNDEIQKENFTGRKPKMTYITGGKTLLTLSLSSLMMILLIKGI